MRFIDFFSGIGGIRLGLEQAGHKCVGYVEYDKYARKSYEAMYDTQGEWTEHDIRTINPLSVPRAELWCFGFPCQDVSTAGKQAGIDGGERSGLFYEIIRLLKGQKSENKPQWLLCENVKNLLNIHGGLDFLKVLLELGQCGYDCQWQVLNSKDFGVPQNRQRVFIVGYCGNGSAPKILPVTATDGKNPCELQEITSGLKQADRIYNGSGIAKTLIGTGGDLERKQAFIDLDEGGKITDNSRSLLARYHKGPMMSSCAANSGVVEFIDLDEGAKITENARTLTRHYNKHEVSNLKAERSGVVEFIDLNEGGEDHRQGKGNTGTVQQGSLHPQGGSERNYRAFIDLNTKGGNLRDDAATVTARCYKGVSTRKGGADTGVIEVKK